MVQLILFLNMIMLSRFSTSMPRKLRSSEMNGTVLVAVIMALRIANMRDRNANNRTAQQKLPAAERLRRMAIDL